MIGVDAWGWPGPCRAELLQGAHQEDQSKALEGR